METKTLALRIAYAARDKKVKKAIILDLRQLAAFCDYLLIISTTSLRQANAVAQGIQEDLEKDRIKPLSKAKADDESGWIVLDYGSAVAHIFFEPMREFYALERLWSDAKRLRIPSRRPA